MSRQLPELSLILKAFSELGPRQVGQYVLYQAGLRSGYYRWRTPPGEPEHPVTYPIHLEKLPVPEKDSLLLKLSDPAQEEASALGDEIRSGQVRLFGGPPVPLRLDPQTPLKHWTAYGSRLLNSATGEWEDIKWTWEPARFAWGILFGRAAYLTGNVSYAEAFWQGLRKFWSANPPNLGPNWSSAQEIALRLISVCLASRICDVVQPLSSEKRDFLSRLVASHAARLPLTLSYARAQNNNHLLSETAGLFTAGILLSEHPRADHWRALGWREFNHGLQSQIDTDGGYTQNSANYHRLMLQLGLWVNLLAISRGDSLPPASKKKLSAATRWLLDLVDPDTGSVPNLGPNDGAHLFPLAAGSQVDYRPVLQAASLAFLGKPAFPPGSWDEMAAWLAPVEANPASIPEPTSPVSGLLVLRPPDKSTWAYLRAAHLSARPGHADQLHLDLWWRGNNIACDAGSYLYNAPPPWDNSLARTAVHNTLMVGGQEQMTHAGRFLWLDRAQAEVLEYNPHPQNGQIWAVAQHDGYRKVGLIHRRKVCWDGAGWLVEDDILPQSTSSGSKAVNVALHWLLPDWPWHFAQETPPRLRLQAPDGWLSILVETMTGMEMEPGEGQYQLARAGALVSGEGDVEPNRGWRALTYGDKEPALSLRYTLYGKLPLRLITRWELTEQTTDPPLPRSDLMS